MPPYFSLRSALILISTVSWHEYLCLAKDSLGMPDKDPTTGPGWGAGEAGLAAYVPFNGPNSFFPPWKVPKPADVPYSALGNFRNPHAAPTTWGRWPIAQIHLA